MERPSIAMIPSAYKDGIVYSVLPINGAGDLTFARATSANTTSTRVESDNEIQEVAPNTPRLDYSGSGCPSFLLEPESTNLITYSEDFTQDWGGGGAGDFTITPNAVVSPDGTQNASKLIAPSGSYQLKQDKAIINTQMSYSFYLRTNQGTRQMSISINDVEISQTFTITSEWKRYTVSGLVGSTLNGAGRCTLRNVDILDENNHVYIWGAQIEALPYATSYIPTSGATATRSAETLSKGGLSSYINSSEGVLYAEIKALSNDSTYRRISLNSSTTSSVVTLYYKDEDDSIRAFISSDGTNGLYLNATGVDILEFNQIALKYNSTSFSLWVNGEEKDSVTNTITLDSLDNISFGSGIGTDIFYGNIKDLRVYTTALTDTELTKLTS